MSIPHKCPVCDGTGLVSRPPGIAGDVPNWSATDTKPYPCRACVNGIVWASAPVPFQFFPQPIFVQPIMPPPLPSSPCSICGLTNCYGMHVTCTVGSN